MAVELIDKIKPKNNGDFALVDAADVEMPDGTRLSEFKPETGSGLPEVSADDNGKVLAVVDGEWHPVIPEIPDELPEVSEADNGKVLVAMNGEWTPVAVEIPEGLPDVTEEDNGKIYSVVNGELVLVPVADSAIKTYIDEYISEALDGDY